MHVNICVCVHVCAYECVSLIESVCVPVLVLPTSSVLQIQINSLPGSDRGSNLGNVGR